MTIFFFQAEDGIRDKLVTGVQTCALPIYSRRHHDHRHASCRRVRLPAEFVGAVAPAPLRLELRRAETIRSGHPCESSPRRARWIGTRCAAQRARLNRNSFELDFSASSSFHLILIAERCTRLLSQSVREPLDPAADHDVALTIFCRWAASAGDPKPRLSETLFALLRICLAGAKLVQAESARPHSQARS